MKCIATALIISSSLSATFALAVSSVSPINKLQLKYFDIRGAAETCRVLLALGDEEYDDARYKIDPATFQSSEFLEAKKNGDLKMNLNRAPVLVAPDGRVIGQSKAIERYLARRLGLMGKTPEDEAIIDCIAEHCRDVKDAAVRKGFSQFVKNKTEEEKARARSEWFETDLPDMLGKFEESLSETSKSPGYSFGDAPTYGDVAIWALLRDCAAADLDDTTKAAEKCNALNAIADQIASNPRVSRWLSERPESMF
jgi:glutathione S-transferase